jgi:leucyl aminopeptidase
MTMQIHFERTSLEQLETEVLIVPVYEGAKEGRFGAAEWFEAGEIAGKAGEMTLLHRPEGLRARRVLFAGAGKAERFDAAEMRKLAGAAVRYLKGKLVVRAVLALEEARATADCARAAVEGAILGDFEPDQYKSEKEGKKPFESFTVAAAGGAELERAVEEGRIVAEAQNLARALANEPANRLGPEDLAARAREVAAARGLEFEVLDRERMRELGMEALLGVAQGSARPPVLIVMRYRPERAVEGVHLGLVGKAVTFDSGGISIKPSDGMEKMRYDMSGGAAVIAAMQALAELQPAIAVTAFIPAVENMPGGGAQRPGDIVRAMSGKTIEVVNTDAEGRLILADALAYARQQGCTHLVDAATLTGAIVVALGHVHVGLFASDEALGGRVQAAGKAAGEKLWPMPLEDDYKEYLKSPFADLPNTGGRWGGAVTAAMFLKEFAADTPWVHLDIAGTAWLEDGKPHLAKGPSGVSVRTLVRLAMDWTA